MVDVASASCCGECGSPISLLVPLCCSSCHVLLGADVFPSESVMTYGLVFSTHPASSCIEGLSLPCVLIDGQMSTDRYRQVRTAISVLLLW